MLSEISLRRAHWKYRIPALSLDCSYGRLAEYGDNGILVGNVLRRTAMTKTKGMMNLMMVAAFCVSLLLIGCDGDSSSAERDAELEAAKKEGFISMLSFPIKCRDTMLGLIRIYHNKSWFLNDEDMDAFSVLAKHLGLAIELNGLKNFVDSIKSCVDGLPDRMFNR